jgi:protein-arginine kinase activator protein McsA
MTEPANAKCRCGTVHVVQPNTKVLCSVCGMAFASFETKGRKGKPPRYDVRAEDLRRASVGRAAKEVVEEMEREHAT